VIDIPVLEETPFKPDFGIVMQETGPLGTRLSSGNVLAVTYDGKEWSAPINLTPDDRMHQDVHAVMTQAGELVTIHNSPRLASAQAGVGGGGALGKGAAAGTLFENGLMAQAIPAVADPAISYCRISDPHAGPGSRLKVQVGIANRGLFATPKSPLGVSLLTVKLSEVRGLGNPREVARRAVPMLAPGAETFLTFDLTMPRDPAQLSVEVDGVRGERDPADNIRLASLGTQPPRNAVVRFLRSDEEGEAAVLRWQNAGTYDGIIIYRDGRRIAELPGRSTSFVDRGLRGIRLRGLQDLHEYAIRGVAGNSKSVRTILQFVKPSGGPQFRRADANSDGNVDIADGISVLNFLFIGGKKPGCLKAADSDDSGSLDITDGIYILNFLFLGGLAPPAPYPSCGEDLTTDPLACSTPTPCP
jgi:hypothetical protein